MNIDELIRELEEVGVHLWEDGGHLRFRAPTGVLTDQRRHLLRDHRAEVLEYLRRVADATSLSCDPAARYEPFPLTDVQSAYLLGRNEGFGYSGVACHLYLELEYDHLDPKRLEEAWNQLVVRHDMLRAVIHPDGYQQVLPEVEHYRIQSDDQRGRLAVEVTTWLARRRDELSHRIYPTGRWPLFELATTRTDETSILHLSMDFLIADWPSIRRLLHELELLHDDPTRLLPPLTVTFRDYVLAHRKLQETSRYVRDRRYWWDRLDTLPAAPELPVLDAPAAVGPTPGRFRRHQFTLKPADWVALKHQATRHGLTPTSAVLACYAEIIGRWSRRPHFTLNLTLLSREPLHPQVEAIVGDFTSVTLLEVDTATPGGFAERAARLGQQLFADLDHRQCTGVEVMRELARRRGREAALMPVVFTSAIGVANDTEGIGRFGHGITQTPQAWIDCQTTEQNGGLTVNFDVRDGVFPAGLIEDMFATFGRLLSDLANEQPWAATDPVTLPLSQRERRRQVNATAAPIPDGLLHEAVVAQARDTPERPAVLTKDRTMSYRELLNRAQAVTAWLAQAGCAPGDLVAIVMDKGWEQVVAALGTMLYGAAYLPVDTSQPAARRNAILTDAQVRLVLTQSWVNADAGWPTGLTGVAVDQLELAPDPTSSPRPALDSEALAYVIYTSGSTGTPKRVMISHRGAANTVADINRRFGIHAGDRVLGLANLGFDLSVYDIFGPLSVGGALVLPDADRQGDPSHWAELVARHHVSVWNSVPAQLQMLAHYLDTEPATELAPLRLVLLSGDWIPVTLPDHIRRWLPDAELVSLGGATEASIWSIHHRIDKVAPDARSIPYGVPLTNQTFHVLDSAMRPCPDWVPGELYIGGAGLAVGYLGDPEGTSQRFLRSASDERLYRTGDWGRYLPDGTIEFLGRQDSQVKIRGYRIELAEIEAALSAHPTVGAAAVLAMGKDLTSRRLVAFVESTRRPTPVTRVDDNQLATAVQAAVTDLAQGITRTEIEQFRQALEQAGLVSMLAALVEAGLFTDPKRGHPVEEVWAVARVAPAHHRLVRRWLTMLEEVGLLSRNASTDRFHATIVADQDQLRAAWNATETLCDDAVCPPAALEYFRASAQALPGLLRGEVNAPRMFFPDGRPHIARALYAETVLARYLNRCVAVAVHHAAEGQPPGATLRILEVGAGIGATTAEVLQRLPGRPVDYLFTDVSQFFLNEARTTFAKDTRIRFGVFDMNRDAREQGLESNSFDVVICAGVLNNAVDTATVLTQLGALLCPGGWLVFIEPTREHIEILTSQAFMMNDPEEARSGGTFHTEADWLRLLTEVGAYPVLCLPEPEHPLSILGQHIFVAQVKNDRAALDRAGLAAHLAQRLPEYMLPSELHHVDSLPLTPNGKVNRSALATWLAPAGSTGALSGPPSSAAEAGRQPCDELERQIAALWTELLGQELIGRDDDFYALGGDSLLIARMVGQLRDRVPEAKELEWEVVLRQMLRQPTVAGLAAYLRSADGGEPNGSQEPRPGTGTGAAPSSPLVLLHGDGSDPATVLVHAGTGTLLPYQALLTQLRARSGGTGSVVGLEVTDPARYLEFDPRALITQLASDYAQLLLDQGGRHFHVVGYCLGGLLATEVASALGEAGARVNSLTVISSARSAFQVDDNQLVEYLFALSMGADSVRLGFPSDEIAFGRAIQAVLAKTPTRIPDGCLAGLTGEHHEVGERFRALAARTPADRLAALHEALPATVQAQAASAGQLAGSDTYTLDQLTRLFSVFRHSVFGMTHDQPQPYAGDITLMRHSGSYNLLPGGQSKIVSYWQQVCLGDLRVIDIPGDHFSCLSTPHAPGIVELLNQITGGDLLA